MAAVLLMSMGEDAAGEVLKHMDATEVQQIGTAMANISDLNKDTVNSVLGEFMNTVNQHTSVGVGAQDYVKKVLVNALGDDKANNIIDRILLGADAKGLEALKWMEPRAIADLSQ